PRELRRPRGAGPRRQAQRPRPVRIDAARRVLDQLGPAPAARLAGRGGHAHRNTPQVPDSPPSPAGDGPATSAINRRRAAALHGLERMALHAETRDRRFVLQALDETVHTLQRDEAAVRQKTCEDLAIGTPEW